MASPAGDVLTPSQQQAIEHFEGPLQVLAGPGSGKTRVITQRIARLVQRGVSPREIVALTFTNKAAREMAERVERLLPGTHVWVTTFHKFCVRQLREHGASLGLKSNFTIYDTGDQQQLIRRAMVEADIDSATYSPSKVLWRIGQLKNDLVSPTEYQNSLSERSISHWDAVTARIYPAYQQLLLQCNGVDFDDILLHTARLLHDQDELRRYLDRRYRYLLIDEYQDTNLAQYRIAVALSQDHPNLCVTGDPDQSIYSWRGARIANILKFRDDYPNAVLVKLEENFRSAPEILTVADTLIVRNTRRQAKVLKPTQPAGGTVELHVFEDSLAEGQGISRQIRAMVETGEWRWSDFAICYRVNALSRALETALVRERIPFQVAAGVAFYERAEVKDVMAYLRLIENPQDDIAFQRIVNVPVRGIGKNSLNKLNRHARERRHTLLETAAIAKALGDLPKRAAVALENFAVMMSELQRLAVGPVGRLVEAVLARTRYSDELKTSGAEEAMQRMSNVHELIQAAHLYDQSAGDAASLQGFLESTSLSQDLDAIDSDEGCVTLMTLHAAKGLEFPAVFVVGLEQNLLPHERALADGKREDLEEERRLLFVGITRAKRQLVLTRTMMRDMRGRLNSTIPSEFLSGLHLHETRHSRTTEVSWEQIAPRPDTRPTKLREDAPQPVAPPRAALPALMTGAELLQQQSTSTKVAFTPHMLVRHPTYGIGRVTEVSEPSRLQTVSVTFERDGTVRKFTAAKCPLQPVGITEQPVEEFDELLKSHGRDA